jgi:SNF2 family DNA or RNA helicase
MDIDTDDEKLPPDDDLSEIESDSDAADGDYNPEESSSSEDSQSTEDMEDDDFKLSEEEEEHDYDVSGDFFEEEDVEQQQENVEKDKFGWRGNFFFSNFYFFTAVNIEFIEEIVLKDYQVDGIKYLKDVLQDPKRGGAILADEMGLGKTSK